MEEMEERRDLGWTGESALGNNTSETTLWGKREIQRQG